MENELVVLHGKEPVTSSITIAKGMELEHRAVIYLVEKYKEKLEKRGELKNETLRLQNVKTGPKTKTYWLNKRQFIFLVTLMRNSDPVIDFKDRLEEAFDKQEKLIGQLLSQRTNQEWQETRTVGKIARREETDAIQRFIQYAKDSESKHSETYWKHLTNATYKALFILEQKFPALRNVLSGHQLQVLAAAETAVTKAITYGMEQNMNYHDIFKLAKERLVTFGEIVGKSLVPVTNTELDTTKPLRLLDRENALQETVF